MDELPPITSFVTPILITTAQSEIDKSPPGYVVGLIIAGCVTSLVIVLYVLYKFHSTCCGWGSETTLTTSFTYSSDTKVTTSEEPVWISVEDSKFDVVRSELNASVIRKEAGWEGEEIPPRRPSNSTGRRMTQAFLDAKQHFADWRTAKRKPKPIRNTRGAVGLAEPLDRHRRRSLFSRQEKYQISVKRLRDIIDA